MATTRSTGRSSKNTGKAASKSSAKTKAQSKSIAKKRGAAQRSGSTLLNSLLRRADVKAVSVETMDAKKLSVDEISVGNSTVESISISNIRTKVNIGRSFLNNVRTITNLDIRVRWEVDVWLFERSDSFRLGSIPIPFTVGDVDIEDLDDIDVSIPSAQVNETVVSIPPVSNLSFNGGVVKDVSVSDIQMPVGGYGLSGLAFDTFSLSHIGLPDAGIASVSIGSIEPNGNITLPSISTDAISIADIQVPLAESNSPITVDNITTEDIEVTLINLGFLKVFIVITPSVVMNIESLTLRDMEASSAIESVSLQNIQFPFKASGVQMSDVKANKLRAEEVSL